MQKIKQTTSQEYVAPKVVTYVFNPRKPLLSGSVVNEQYNNDPNALDWDE